MATEGALAEVMAIAGALSDIMTASRLSGDGAMGEPEARAAYPGVASRVAPGRADELRDPVMDELFRLGPIEPLLRDPSVTEVMVNAPREVWVERGGVIERAAVAFADEAHVRRVIERIVSADNHRCDEASPLCDCTLRRPGEPFDGSRVNAVLPPISRSPALTVRKFRTDALTPEQLLDGGAFDGRTASILRELVRGRMNVVVSGGTGSGKTTLLNCLSTFIPEDQRVITIEDTAELKIAQEDWVSLVARQANSEGAGEVTIHDLVINSLRQRPDRIIVGECRGPEAFEMVQAMNTGHDGSLTTVHANDPRGCIGRLQSMIQMAGYDMSVPAIRKMVSEALDFIVQVKRFPDGSRRVVELCEVCGMEGEVVTLQPIVRFAQDPYAGGAVTGRFEATGARPTHAHLERLEAAGARLEGGWFM